MRVIKFKIILNNFAEGVTIKKVEVKKSFFIFKPGYRQRGTTIAYFKTF